MFIHYEINGEVITDIDDLHIFFRKYTPTARYLYDSKLVELNDMKYREALEHKIELSQILMVKLYNVHFMFRDNTRISKTINSQKHNRNLIDELPKKRK